MKTLLFVMQCLGLLLVSGVASAVPDDPSVAPVISPAPVGGLQVELSHILANSGCGGPVNGFIEGDEVRLVAKVKGASGSVRYRFWYTNEGFKMATHQSAHGQTDVSSEKGGSSSRVFRIRSLLDDVARIHMTMGVTAQDSSGRTGSGFIRMRVSRPIILERDESKLDPVCYQTYPPECISAEYLNQNDTDLKLTVSQVEQKLKEQRFQKGSSWTISPSVFFSGVAVSFFSYQWGHFNALASQASDTVYLTVENVMNPGDVGTIYRQSTRLMLPYKVFVLNACRKEMYTGHAYLDSWQRAYNLIKRDPLKTGVCELNNVGSPITNTCNEFDQSMVKYQFFGDHQ